jgi:hypothetical protein
MFYTIRNNNDVPKEVLTKLLYSKPHHITSHHINTTVL